MQKCFPGLKPKMPTICTESVAIEIAKRIVDEVNLDDFYWEPEEKPDRIEDVKLEIMRCGRPESVFERLNKKYPLPNLYGWKGIDEHCRYIANKIANEELEKAKAKHKRDYQLTATAKKADGS